MSLEAALAEHTAAIKENTARLDQVIAGQQAALAKITGAPTPKPTAAKKDDPKPEAPKEPVLTAPKEPEAPVAGVVTDDDLKATVGVMIDKKSKEERAVLLANVNAALEWMGFEKGSKVTGPEAKLNDDQRKQMKFFMERWTAGLDVNFSSDYDFDGPVDQGAEAADDDQFG